MEGLSLFATDVCLTLICKGTAQKRPVVMRKTVAVHKITTICCILRRKKEIEDVKGSPEQSSLVVSNLSVNNATTENNRRIFVLLKVIPLRVTAENGRTLTTYGMLDSAAASSMITSNITDKLQLQGVPENVNINTVTLRGQNLELCKVKLQISSASQGGAFPVYHALTVIGANVVQKSAN